MSRARVITGTDEHGRPVSHWVDVAAAEASPYGFMEPAHEPVLTRRMATRAELAAATARETPTGYLHALPVRESRPLSTWTGMATAERMKISRARGAERSHEVMAAARLAPVHPIVAEVARKHMVTVAGLLSRARPPYLVDARAEAARRLFLEHPEMRLREIGGWLGGRDHSTVHALIRRAVR